MTIQVLSWEQLKEKRVKHTEEIATKLYAAPLAKVRPLRVDPDHILQMGCELVGYNTAYPAVAPYQALVFVATCHRANKYFVWENFPLKESMLIRVQKLSYPPSYMICAVSEDPWHVSFGAHRGLVQVRGSIYLSNFCRCHWSDTPEETVVIPVASRLLSPLIKLVRRRKPFTDAEYVPVYTNTKEECDAASENPDQSLDESYRRDTLATLGISEWTRGVWIYTNMCRLSDDGKSILSERGRGRSIQVDELEQLSNGTWKPGGNVPKSDSGEAKAKPERVVSPEAVMEAHETQHEMEVARDELALQA